MTPYYDDKLRASFTGVGMHHTKAHFSRSVMEGVAYSMRDCLEEVKRMDIAVSEYRMIGGGAKGALWRQILCDVLAVPLTVTVGKRLLSRFRDACRRRRRRLLRLQGQR